MQNTNNKGKAETGEEDENLDMFISYEMREDNALLDDIDKLLGVVQMGIARFVKSKATISNLWALSEADKKTLKELNKGFDELMVMSEIFIGKQRSV